MKRARAGDVDLPVNRVATVPGELTDPGCGRLKTWRVKLGSLELDACGGCTCALLKSAGSGIEAVRI